MTRYLLIFLLALPLGAQNLIPNSGFELGMNRGWVPWGNINGTFQGNVPPESLLSTDANSGRYSFSLGIEARVQSRFLWLTNGDYTLTFSAKCSAATHRFGLMYAADAAAGTAPRTNFTGTTSWARYTNWFNAPSNGWYYVKFYQQNATPMLLDDVKLEPGLTASAYAPQAPVELGIAVPATNHMWFSGGPGKFNMNFWNTGAASNVVARYEVYDAWNSNVVSATIATTCAAATNTSRTITLPTKTGWFRVTTRLAAFDDSHDEAALVVYPYASNITAAAETDWLGGHPMGSSNNAARAVLANRKIARSLGPMYASTRWDTIEPTRGNLTFNDTMTNWTSAGMKIVATLTPTDGIWPSWVTNSSDLLLSWSNYVYRVMNRYHVTLGLSNNIYWELGPNEPKQSGPETNINVRTATEYANVLTWAVNAATNATAGTPSPVLIGMCGASGDGEWAWEVWTNLTAGTQAEIDLVSTHLYPQDSVGNDIDPNIPFNTYTKVNNDFGWIGKFSGVRDVWNTESGVNSALDYKTLNLGWPTAYDFFATYTYESQRSERMHRQTANLVRTLCQGLRSIGYGVRKYFYYDNRYFNDSAFAQTVQYGQDWLQVDRPDVTALSIATHFVAYGFGRVTNINAGTIEAYAYTNSLGHAVIAAWNWDRTNRTVTMTNTSYALYDAMGAQVQTNTADTLLTRFPQYFVSSTLTLAQLSNTVRYAAVAGTADTLAPQISIDVAPSGPWAGVEPALVRWVAMDNVYTAFPLYAPSAATNTTNVVFRWKLNAGAYSDYSQSNHVWLTGLNSGANTFYVQAKDKVGNESTATYEFSPSAAANINLNVTTMTVDTAVFEP